MAKIYFEDFSLGEKIRTKGRTITETDNMIFSALVSDFSELETNEEFAKTSPYQTRLVHGLLTLAITEGLLLRLRIFDSIEDAQYRELRDLKFTSPVRPGDTITVEFEVVAKDLDPNDGATGRVTLKRLATNQHGDTVCEAVTVYRLPLAAKMKEKSSN